MPRQWTKDFNFISGAYCNNTLITALTTEEAADEAIALSIIAAWDHLKWKLREPPYTWSVVDCCSVQKPFPSAVFLGFDGEILYVSENEMIEENISSFVQEGPLLRGPMSGIRSIGTSLYAVGMGRQVYKCPGRGQWLCLDSDIQPDYDAIVGFNSIDGFSEQEIYTVGLNGEIWWSDSKNWYPVDSPTNMPLTYVYCDNDGFVYACGRNGAIVFGRKEIWKLFDNQEGDDDYWSILRYRNKLYVVGAHGLYRLENGTMESVIIPDESVGFGQSLFLGNDCMCLLGPKDLLQFNGEVWTRVD